MKLRRKLTQLVALSLSAAMLLSACGGGSGETQEAETVDLNSMTMEEIIEGAKAEGRLETTGMPDDWANWGESWASFSEMYGIEHYDTDMASAETVAIFAAEKDSPTKDFGDVGQAFALTAVQNDVLQGYKVSTWDSIPDWAKDPEGRWYVTYTGTNAFLTNPNLTGGEIPESWEDIKNGTYMVSPGNVIGGASSQVAVLACAIAYGGGLDNVQPGIDFFKELAEQGRLDPADPTRDRVATSEVACMLARYDFQCLSWRDEINAADPSMNLVATIPSDSSVTSGYALLFNKWAPHPCAAALGIEYLLSDQGQIERAKSYARPIRSDVEIPEEIAAKMLPDSAYENSTEITDVEAFAAACSEIARLWEEEVLPLIS